MAQSGIILTIAGFDPASGAGITADLKTIAAHGLYGVSAVTALTVQSTQGVFRILALDPEFVRETLEALLDDGVPRATKIGMLGSGEMASMVADFLRAHRLPNTVLDPVLQSSSGAHLIDDPGFDVLRKELLGLVDVITPNSHEAAMLTGVDVANVCDIENAGRKLLDLGARNAVVTGGHLPEKIDVLAQTDGNGTLRFRRYPGGTVQTTNTHGTGCAFSTALACNLGLGFELSEAVLRAKRYVEEALRSSYSTGKGVGPVNHFWGFKRAE